MSLVQFWLEFWAAVSDSFPHFRFFMNQNQFVSVCFSNEMQPNMDSLVQHQTPSITGNSMPYTVPSFPTRSPLESRSQMLASSPLSTEQDEVDGMVSIMLQNGVTKSVPMSLLYYSSPVFARAMQSDPLSFEDEDPDALTWLLTLLTPPACFDICRVLNLESALAVSDIARRLLYQLGVL